MTAPATTPAGAPGPAWPVQASELSVDLAGRTLGPFTVAVAPGETVLLLGPNGSGKTTTLRLVLGLDRPALGVSRVFGSEVSPLRPPSGVGYVPDRAEFFDWCSATDNLLASGCRREAAAAWIERVDLTAAGRAPVRRFSRGMRQRLSLARAFCRAPRLLVMDEPTIALDRAGTSLLLELLHEHHAEGGSALIASHDSDFVTGLPARRVHVQDGRTR